MASIPDPNEVFDQYAVEPLAEPVEVVPDPVDEIEGESDIVKGFELGRKIGAIGAEDSWMRGYMTAVLEDRPCPRKHRGDRVYGSRPRTYGQHR